MKKIPFIKMAGAGNDFIIMNAPKGTNLKKLAIQVCDRTNGIGADGLLLLDKSKKADYKMRIINADGSEAEMCGNGARCMVAYIHQSLKPKKRLITMDTLAGLVKGEVSGKLLRVNLSDPVGYKADIPLTINHRKIHVHSIDTGVPHTIVYVDHIDQMDVSKIGQAVRYHSRFKPRGTNVDFVEQINNNLIDVRTYERGVENETRACGTGSVAAAIVTYLKANPKMRNKKQAKMNVRTKGKEILEVTFDLINGNVSNVWLKGSANFIAKGEYYV